MFQFFHKTVIRELDLVECENTPEINYIYYVR